MGDVSKVIIETFCEFLQTDRSNYRPISLLLPILKIFERLIGSQLNGFLENKLSNLFSAFRKGYSTQDALLRVIESWRKCLDASGIVGIMLMDLLKAYDCIRHDLLIDKLEAYGLDRNSLKRIYSYLTGTQRVTVRFLAIKAQVANRSCSSPRDNISNGSTTGNHLHEAFIRSLQERRISLKKQLNDKQRIIEKILDGPSHHSPMHCVNNQSSKATAPPMGIGQTPDDSNTTVGHNSYHKNSLEGLPISNKKKTKENGNAKTDNQRSSISRPEEKQDEKSKQGKTTKQSKTVRKGITIVGDSILNGLEEAGMQKDHNVKIRAHSGAMTRDIVDHITPVVRIRPSCIIIHSGTSDLTQRIDTIVNYKERH